MQVPLEVAFHNIEGPDWAEHEVYYVDAMGDTGPIASKVRTKRSAAAGRDDD